MALVSECIVINVFRLESNFKQGYENNVYILGSFSFVGAARISKHMLTFFLAVILKQPQVQ